jgi:hypothetical protein
MKTNLLFSVLIIVVGCTNNFGVDYQTLLSEPVVHDLIINTGSDEVVKQAIDTSLFVTVHVHSFNDTVRVSTYINNVKNLWCYQFMLSYDTTTLKLVASSVKGILGLNVIGLIQYQLNPVPDSSKICFASTIVGSDSLNQVSGSGLIGESLFISNKAKVNVEVTDVYVGGYDESKSLDTVKVIKYIEE